jgi:hypothetical protein
VGEALDDALLARLREIAAHADGVPEYVLAAAKAGLTLRDLDGELAELVADTALDSAGTAVRANGTEPRLLTFEAESLVVSVEVGGATLQGDVGDGPGEASLELPDGERRTSPVDEHGRFRFQDLSTGPARLRIRVRDATVTTSWVPL